MSTIDERVKELLKVDENIKLTEEEFLSIIKQQFEKRYFPVDSVSLTIRPIYPIYWTPSLKGLLINDGYEVVETKITETRDLCEISFLTVFRNKKHIYINDIDVSMFLQNHFLKQINRIRVDGFKKSKEHVLKKYSFCGSKIEKVKEETDEFRVVAIMVNIG